MRLVMVVLLGLAMRLGAQSIMPGEVWKDTAGKPIQAHGGGVIREGKEWFWFGEDRLQELAKEERAVGCYRSADLMHWTSCGRPLRMREPAEWVEKYGANWQLERPKVFVVKGGAHRFVMYMHLDAAYKAAEVGVAVADRIEGPYVLVKHFRPLGQESRDIGQFVDDDGANYLVFESRPTKGFFIAKLSVDGMDVEETSFVRAPLEGGAVAHVDGLYYVVGSHMTGWKANPNVYATAKSLSGPWTEFKDIAPPEKNTYGSQSTMLLTVKGTKATTVIYMGDVWKPEELWDSRYVWMPMTVGNGVMRLAEPRPWGLDVRTGEVR